MSTAKLWECSGCGLLVHPNETVHVIYVGDNEYLCEDCVPVILRDWQGFGLSAGDFISAGDVINLPDWHKCVVCRVLINPRENALEPDKHDSCLMDKEEEEGANYGT